MKNSAPSICCLVLSLLVGVVTLAAPASAQSAGQTLTLSAGWNAVWLEVEPVDANGQTKAPADVFNNPSIQTVASPKSLAGLSEIFASEPGTITTFNQAEWLQWRRVDTTGTNNLPLVMGNRPYLIRVADGTPAFSIPISGKARFFRPTWTADRYNLLGFGLSGAPTFDGFFGPSGAKHPVAKIFTLTPAGNWVNVTGSATMASGKAYWIYSSGPSAYMGPVSVDFKQATTGRLDFGGPGDSVTVGTGVDALDLDLNEITFSNLGSTSAVPGLDLISSSGSGLGFYTVRPATGGLGYVRGNQVDSSVGAGSSSALGETVASLSTATLTIGGRRSWVDDLSRTNYYRLATGTSGASFWLPVMAVRTEVQITGTPSGGTPASAVTGLWVGDAIANRSTSIVEDGSPVRATAGSAPIRIILHSGPSGAVRLLSQVTIMQTKSADPAIEPIPVLVVDPAKIPFFEGIKERNGKRVGMRLEAIAYDMPRSASAWTGADLRTFGIRPSTLLETYDLSQLMTGSVGAGQTVSGTLVLDPFHRSNPFRHAYHQNLPRGPQVTRAISIKFDSTQSIPDRLLGTFTDEIQGLIKNNLTVTGTVELRRVSPVDSLN
ncbi:MAG: hypothetical protein V4819_21050 [Verrucomicrobiota bacterium]